MQFFPGFPWTPCFAAKVTYARQSWSFIQTLRSQHWRGRHGPSWVKRIEKTYYIIIYLACIYSIYFKLVDAIYRLARGNEKFWAHDVGSQCCPWTFYKTDVECFFSKQGTLISYIHIMLGWKKTNITSSFATFNSQRFILKKRRCMCPLGWCCAMPDAVLHSMWKLQTMNS